MDETLPMLEEHPFVPRYNWMSALTEIDVELNDKDSYELNSLGMKYNSYVWDGKPTHNPQWGNFETSKFSNRSFAYLYLFLINLFPFKYKCIDLLSKELVFMKFFENKEHLFFQSELLARQCSI